MSDDIRSPDLASARDDVRPAQQTRLDPSIAHRLAGEQPLPVEGRLGAVRWRTRRGSTPTR